jgi:hypothetical protein
VEFKVIIEPAQIKSSSHAWVVLEIGKHCLVVLPREQFKQGLRRGKAWRRSAAMKARLGTKGDL